MIFFNWAIYATNLVLFIALGNIANLISACLCPIFLAVFHPDT